MSQAFFPGLTGDQAKLLRVDESEGCSQDSSKCALRAPPPPATTLLPHAVCLTGAKRLGMAGGSASKRRALADLGNIARPLGQRKTSNVSRAPTSLSTAASDAPLPVTSQSSSLQIQDCAPPQVGPFPLASTIWSSGVSGVPPTAHAAALTQPRETCLWGELHPHPSMQQPVSHFPSCRYGVPLAPVPFPWGRGCVH